MKSWIRAVVVLHQMWLCACGRAPAQQDDARPLTPGPSAPVAEAARDLPNSKAVSTADHGIPVKWWSGLELGVLSDAVAQYNARALDTFGQLKRSGQMRQPNDCVDWTRLHAEGYEPVDALSEQTDNGAKLRCMTLLLLQRAQPSKRSYLRELAWDATFLPLLPAAVATAFNKQKERAIQRATAQQQSFAEFDSRARAGRTQEDTLEIVEGDKQTMILLHAEAWGDLNGDGDEDLVLSVTNGATQGTYSYVRLLVLSRASVNSPLRQVDVK